MVVFEHRGLESGSLDVDIYEVAVAGVSTYVRYRLSQSLWVLFRVLYRGVSGLSPVVAPGNPNFSIRSSIRDH